MKTLATILLLISFCGTKAQSWISIRDSIVYDLSGVTRKGSAGAYKYFSTNTSDDGRITRNVADFNRDSLGGRGWKVLINLQQEYTLATDSAIKFYDPSGSVDTVDIYVFDKDNAPKWDTIINTHLYTPTYRITSCGSCSGLPVTTVLASPAGRKVQFILVVIKRTNLFSGLWPDIRAIQFKGTLTGDKDTTYNLAHWAFNQWTADTIGSIVGNFNLQNQQDTLWHDTATGNANLGYARTFDQMFFFPDATKTGKRLDLGGGGYTAYKYNQALARRGNYLFSAIFNDNAYYKFQLDSIGHSVTKGWGINTIYDDPQLPLSYSEKGLYMHGLAWIGGSCSGCASVPTFNGTAVPGQGWLKGLGTSNEPSLFAFANAWKTPIEIAAEAIGVYDSVKLGDPDMPVLFGGFEAFNYDDAKAVIMLMKLHARSRNIKTDGVSFHGIHTLKTDSFPYIPTSNQQIGNHGVSVGYNDDWRKEIHYVQGIRREAGNPNLIGQLDEDGHQKGVYKRKPTDVGETFSVSQLGTPRFTVNAVTLNAYQSHGVAALQDIMISTASPIYKHYWYTAVDDVEFDEDPAYDAIDGNNGLFDRPFDFTDEPQIWPAGYAITSFKKRFSAYRFVDSTYDEPRGIHVFKYTHHSITDSVLYLFAVLDSTGTDTYEITGLNNTAGKLITPSLTTRIATESSESIIDGSYTLNADPLPRGFLVFSPDEGEPPAPPPYNNKRRTNLKIKRNQ